MATIDLGPETPVLVTGAASGIGAACAEALAAVKRDIALWDIDEAGAGQVADRIRSEHGVKAEVFAVDVANLDAIEAAVREARSALGSIGGLVHAAGLDGAVFLESMTPEDWARVMDINLRAQVFILQHILPDLKANPGSAVVGIASINGTLGNAANPVYSASKAGLLGVSRALADDFANAGVRINCVSPGQIDTPMLQHSMNAVPGLRESFEQRILLGRLADIS